MVIRELISGEESQLRRIFSSSVHSHAQGFYTPEQLAAWATTVYDEDGWIQRLARLKPYVVEDGGRIVAYADLQETGLIDHFFVAGDAGGRGFGTALMDHLLEMALQRQMVAVHAFVSRSAEGFFAKHGFTVDDRRTASIGGVQLSHARMTRNVSSRRQG